MAPRGRPRKIGLSRMDAAIDAMSPLGFAKELVKRIIKQLLQVYEGDEGWVFIEEASYKLLVETILEEQEKTEHDNDSSKEIRGQDDAEASCSGFLIEAPNIEEPSNNALAIDEVRHVAMPRAPTESGHEAPKLSWVEKAAEGRDHKNVENNNGECSNISNEVIEYRKPVENVSKKRRIHYHGWIDSDEKIVIAELSSPGMSLEQFNKLIGGKPRRTKGKSLWDLQPEI